MPPTTARNGEPQLLPARFPNLLANGAVGIAVGMATSIPPHNAGELCDALGYLIKHPQATFDKLVDLIPGPDFPTGGVLIEPRSAIVEAYRTGRGGFRLQRPVGGREAGARPIPDRGRRDSLSRPEVAPDREGGGAPGAAQAAPARRHPRRIGGRRAHRFGTPIPRRRARDADGATVPPHRPGSPRRPQHERARRHEHAARNELARVSGGLPRSPPPGAGAAHPPPPGAYRAPPRCPGRVCWRLT